MILSFAMLSLSVWAQTPIFKTPQEAVAYLQGERMKTGQLYRKATPTKDELDQSVKQIEDQFKLWQSPALQFWARGDMRLLIKGRELSADRAIVAAKSGNKDDLVKWLQIAVEQGSGAPLAEVLEREPSMAVLSSEPNVRRLLGRMRALTSWSQNLDFVTPSRDLYSGEEKIVALAVVWRQVDQHLPFAAKLVDWQKTFVDSITKVGNAKNAFEVFSELQQFAATRQDGLTSVSMPFELAQQHQARALVSTRIIEGKVLISAIDPAVSGLAVQFGDEILSVDGQPVKNYAEALRRPMVSASTPHGLNEILYGDHLLEGELGKPVRLLVRHAGGKTDEVAVPRTLPNLKAGASPLEVYKGAEGYMVLSVKHFDSLSILQALEANEKVIGEAKGVILDLRECQGGLRVAAQGVAQRFSAEPIAWLQESSRVSRSDYVARGVEWAEASIDGDMIPSLEKNFAKSPLVVLVSSRTSHVAEELAEVLQSTKRATVFGQPSAGVVGLTYRSFLPGGGTVAVAATRVAKADGQPLSGVGVIPNSTVAETLDAFRSRRDETLEAALKALKSK